MTTIQVTKVPTEGLNNGSTDMSTQSQSNLDIKRMQVMVHWTVLQNDGGIQHNRETVSNGGISGNRGITNMLQAALGQVCLGIADRG